MPIGSLGIGAILFFAFYLPLQLHHHEVQAHPYFQSAWPQQPKLAYQQMYAEENDGPWDGFKRKREPGGDDFRAYGKISRNGLQANCGRQSVKFRLGSGNDDYGNDQKHRRVQQEMASRLLWPPIENSELPEFMIGEERKEICPDGNFDLFCEHFKQIGWPKEDPLLWKEEFLISFNQRTRLANWVLEKLTPKDLFSNGQFDRPYFYNEPNLDELYSVTEQDYWDLPKQDLDRKPEMNHGHLAPASNHKSNEFNYSATFTLANVAPQNKHLNNGAWNWIETRARLAILKGELIPIPDSWPTFGGPIPPKEQQQGGGQKIRICPGRCSNAFIYTGPLFRPAHEGTNQIKYKTVGKHQLAIPSHFFKIILIQTPNGIHEETYVLPNENIKENDFRKDYEKYKVPLESNGLLHLLLPNAHLLKNPLEKLPETIHQFWERFGYPNDHKIGRNTEMVYSCNGHTNLLNWRLKFINAETNLNILYKQAQNDGANYGKCSPNLDMGLIGKDIDSYANYLATSKRQGIYVYSGPLFPAINGFVQYEELENEGHKIAKAVWFFKIIALVNASNGVKLQHSVYIFPNVMALPRDYSRDNYSKNIRLVDVEKQTGIRFFNNVKKEDLVEIKKGNEGETRKEGEQQRKSTWKRIYWKPMVDTTNIMAVEVY